MTLNAKVIRWLAKRGITAQTAQNFGVSFGNERFGDSEKPCVVFNYFENSTIVNYKARSLVGKEFTQKKNGRKMFYNSWNITPETEKLYICEGEIDALSLSEAGIPMNQIASVVNGAPAFETEDPQEAKRYDYVVEAEATYLSNIKQFCIVVDADSQGRNLQADLVSLLGAARCSYVEWPDSVSDANEALMKWGAEDLSIYLREAEKLMPIDGLYRMSEIPEPPNLTLWRGWAEWENKLLLSPTCLSIMSGWPGHGKSHLSQQLWMHIAKEYKITVSLMSLETRLKPMVRRNLRTAYCNKLEKDMSESQLREADDFIETHFLFMHHPTNSPTFEWIAQKIEESHARYAVDAKSIDPFNMIMPTFDQAKTTETQWIGGCLDICTYLCKAYNIHVQILAHPAKPVGANSREPITYSSIAGSQHWANKPDQVMSIHRDKFTDEFGGRATDSRLIVHKSRYEELGYPCELKMNLNLLRGTFECTEYSQF